MKKEITKINEFLYRGTDYVCKLAIKRKERVFIDHENETGENLWAVVLAEIPDFWVTDGFKTKKEALEFCKKNKLPIVKED